MDFSVPLPALLERLPARSGITLLESRFPTAAEQNEWRDAVCAQREVLLENPKPLSDNHIRSLLNTLAVALPEDWDAWRAAFDKHRERGNAWDDEVLMCVWVMLLRNESVPGIGLKDVSVQRGKIILRQITERCQFWPRGPRDPLDRAIFIQNVDRNFFKLKAMEVGKGLDPTRFFLDTHVSVRQSTLSNIVQIVAEHLPLTWADWGELSNRFRILDKSFREEYNTTYVIKRTNTWFLWLNLLQGPDDSEFVKRARDVDKRIADMRSKAADTEHKEPLDDTLTIEPSAVDARPVPTPSKRGPDYLYEMDYGVSLDVLFQRLPAPRGRTLLETILNHPNALSRLRKALNGQALEELAQCPLTEEHNREFLNIIAKALPVDWVAWKQVIDQYKRDSKVDLNTEALFVVWLMALNNQEEIGLYSRARQIQSRIAEVCRYTSADLVGELESYDSSCFDRAIFLQSVDREFTERKVAEVAYVSGGAWEGPRAESTLRTHYAIRKCCMADLLSSIEMVLPLNWTEWAATFSIFSNMKKNDLVRRTYWKCWFIWLNILRGPEDSPHTKKGIELDRRIQDKRKQLGIAAKAVVVDGKDRINTTEEAGLVRTAKDAPQATTIPKKVLEVRLEQRPARPTAEPNSFRKRKSDCEAMDAPPNLSKRQKLSPGLTSPLMISPVAADELTPNSTEAKTIKPKAPTVAKKPVVISFDDDSLDSSSSSSRSSSAAAPAALKTSTTRTADMPTPKAAEPKSPPVAKTQVVNSSDVDSLDSSSSSSSSSEDDVKSIRPPMKRTSIRAAPATSTAFSPAPEDVPTPKVTKTKATKPKAPAAAKKLAVVSSIAGSLDSSSSSSEDEQGSRKRKRVSKHQEKPKGGTVPAVLFTSTQKRMMDDNFKLAQMIGKLKSEKKQLMRWEMELKVESRDLKKRVKTERRKERG